MNRGMKTKFKRRRICVVTTSRADYGLLIWLMREIREDPSLELLIVATGMHLSPEFGSTYKVIEEDGFTINAKVEMLLSSDTDIGVVKSIGIGLLSFCEVLKDLSPDIIVILGDRFELFSVAVSALILRIPIAHIHGGETSQGSVDEAVRHAVTKMSAVHFPATEVYRKRIIQMGEIPKRVFNYGAPGLDGVHRVKLLSKKELEKRLGFNLEGNVAIVTYHPVTLERGTAEWQIDDMLRAIHHSGLKAIFTKANADEQGRLINRKIQEFCGQQPDTYRFYDNLGTFVYLSCLKHCTLMVGNSSSGLIEAPSFRLPVVNIGDRQRGRIRAANVIDVGYSEKEISDGIKKACSKPFRRGLSSMENPYDTYGDGKTSYRIKESLKNIKITSKLLKKGFFDITF
jgi:UDP-N-acetylglucosamine 2-epimerase (non-hydrolysing)/GDP/UDP-N,N'-diacetylbacillosamine 2-epimerase (hydrolysing)